MKVIISYDVNVTGDGGKRRLRRVAKTCMNFGQRVQNSVFECEVDWAQLVELRAALEQEMDTSSDSLRIYNLGNRYAGKVEHIGVKSVPDLKGDTLFI